MVRWEEPHHPGPLTNSGRHTSPLCSTSQHIVTPGIGTGPSDRTATRPTVSPRIGFPMRKTAPPRSREEDPHEGPGVQGALQLDPGEEAVEVGEQAGGDHQQDRGHQQQGDGKLDLGRGASRVLLDPAALRTAERARLLVELLGQG